MYTGFISEVGEIVEAGGEQLIVTAPKTCGELREGGSVNVNGVCLSAEVVKGSGFRVSLSDETQRRSTLGDLQRGSRVNLELPLRIGSPLEGHLVQGHVDALGKVTRVDSEASSRRVWLRPPERVMSEVTAKGSITVDGVSLTVAEVVRDRFSVALVPSTLKRSTLGALESGQRVNLETDLVAKLAQRHARGDVVRALSRTIARLPWAGVVSGQLGVEKVVQQIAAGGSVIVWDPEREGEGDVIAAGSCLRPETFTFLLTEVCGHTTVPCAADWLERLEIPPMPGPGDHHGTAMHVSVDLSAQPGTGVSAAQRAATVRKLADPAARPTDFVAPGHVFPLAERSGGLRVRAGHTEATVALCRAADLAPVGVCCELMNRDGDMAGFGALERFALEWGLPMIEIGELVERL